MIKKVHENGLSTTWAHVFKPGNKPSMRILAVMRSTLRSRMQECLVHLKNALIPSQALSYYETRFRPFF